MGYIIYALKKAKPSAERLGLKMKKEVVISGVLVLLVLFVSGCTQIEEEPVCGNNICESGETTTTCPQDCQIITCQGAGYKWFEDTEQCGLCKGEGRTEGYYDVDTDTIIIASNCMSLQCVNEQCVAQFVQISDDCSTDADCVTTVDCTDSDGGKNYYTKGSCLDSYDIPFEDSCTTENVVHEMYCHPEDSNCVASEVNCEYGCVNGECQPASSDWYNYICDSDDLANFVVEFEGTDDELYAKLKDFCLDLGTDHFGCEVTDERYVSQFTDNADGYYWVECNSVCERSTNGFPTSGKTVFLAIWKEGEPRELYPYTYPRAGQLVYFGDCGYMSMIQDIFALFGLDTKHY